jgi:hypothetical protein
VENGGLESAQLDGRVVDSGVGAGRGVHYWYARAYMTASCNDAGRGRATSFDLRTRFGLGLQTTYNNKF